MPECLGRFCLALYWCRCCCCNWLLRAGWVGHPLRPARSFFAPNQSETDAVSRSHKISTKSIIDASFCCSVLFYSLDVLDTTVGHTMDVLSPFIFVILIDSSTGSPVHVLMLSIQAVRGLFDLRAPGIVPCIISFYRQLPSTAQS